MQTWIASLRGHLYSRCEMYDVYQSLEFTKWEDGHHEAVKIIVSLASY